MLKILSDALIEAIKEYSDVQQVLLQLQRAPVENHLPAFQRCVERSGESGRGRWQRHRQGQNF